TKKATYLSGNHITRELPCKQRIVAYHSNAATHFSETLIALLKEKKIHYVPFFSTRTAEICVSLIQRYQLEDACKDIHAVTLSTTIAQSLQSLPFKKLSVCNEPETDSLLAKMQDFLLTSG